MSLVGRLLSREVLTFLAVGGLGYVVDVAVFNHLLGSAPFDGWDPSIARILAMGAAMVVTFAGNALITWRGSRPGRRELVLFVVLNLIGLGFSVVCLWISHDALGLTSRLADNVSANGVGLVLGTVFRFATYKLLVFGPAYDAGEPTTARRVDHDRDLHLRRVHQPRRERLVRASR